MPSSGFISPQLKQGACLGDIILLSGAAVYLGRQLGGVRIVSSNYCYQSAVEIFANNSEVEVCCGLNEHETNQRWPKLVDVNDHRAIINHLGDKPKTWYMQLGVPFSEFRDSCPIPAITDPIEPADQDIVFIHDDTRRNQIIDIDGYRPPLTSSIFDHVPMIKAAHTIHCMNSAFFHLIEAMSPVKATLFYHLYIRKPYPDLPMRYPWIIVDRPI